MSLKPRNDHRSRSVRLQEARADCLMRDLDGSYKPPKKTVDSKTTKLMSLDLSRRQAKIISAKIEDPDEAAKTAIMYKALQEANNPVNLRTLVNLVAILGYDAVAIDPRGIAKATRDAAEAEGVKYPVFLEESAPVLRDAVPLYQEFRAEGYEADLILIAELRRYLGDDIIREYAPCLDIFSSAVSDLAEKNKTIRSIVLGAVSVVGSLEGVEHIVEDTGVVALQPDVISAVSEWYRAEDRKTITRNINLCGGLDRMVAEARKQEMSLKEVYETIAQSTK